MEKHGKTSLVLFVSTFSFLFPPTRKAAWTCFRGHSRASEPPKGLNHLESVALGQKKNVLRPRFVNGYRNKVSLLSIQACSHRTPSYQIRVPRCLQHHETQWCRHLVFQGLQQSNYLPWPGTASNLFIGNVWSSMRTPISSKDNHLFQHQLGLRNLSR